MFPVEQQAIIRPRVNLADADPMQQFPDKNPIAGYYLYHRCGNDNKCLKVTAAQIGI
jgi:hypothetical protein